MTQVQTPATKLKHKPTHHTLQAVMPYLHSFPLLLTRKTSESRISVTEGSYMKDTKFSRHEVAELGHLAHTNN